MQTQLATLSVEDDGAAAATVIREHRVKHLPIVSCRGHRRLVGCLRTRRLMAHVFRRITRHCAGLERMPNTLNATES